MSTRSYICYETETGDAVGVYCHFDGYPSNQLPQLREMSHGDVRAMVEDALVNGGMRSLGETYCERSTREEWLVSEFPPTGGCADYSYLVKRDGSISWCDRSGNITVDDGENHPG